MLERASKYRLDHQLESLVGIIQPLDEAERCQHFHPGKWSIQENISHLGRYQVVFLERMEQVLREEEPVLTRYKAEDDPEFSYWLSLSTEALLERMTTDRKSIISFTETLNSTQWNRIGHHPKFGALRIIDWVEFFLLHEAHHLYTIFRIAKEIARGKT